MVFFAGDAEPPATISAPSSRGLGRRPLKAVTPVRIRSGLHQPRSAEALTRESAGRSLVASAPGDAPPGPTRRRAAPGAGRNRGKCGRVPRVRRDSGPPRPALPVRRCGPQCKPPPGAVAPSANPRMALCLPVLFLLVPWPPVPWPFWRRGPQCPVGETASTDKRHMGWRGSGASVIWAGGEAVRGSHGLPGKRCGRHLGRWGHQRDMGLCWKLGICDISGRCAVRPAGSGRR
jgi:hypothetical protein